MKVARLNLLLLAIVTVLVCAAAPSSASALGPKPTVTGIPTSTNVQAVNFTLSTTVDSTWFVDFGCGYDTAFINRCDYSGYPSCTPPVGGQHTCSQTYTQQIPPEGKHFFRFAAAYCDDASLSECEANDDFISSPIETVTFTVDRTRPMLNLDSGSVSFLKVLEPGVGSFVFSSNEVVSFTCSLDGADAFPCTSPFAVPKYLKNRMHSFKVLATDAAGNQSPARLSFFVDVFHPKRCAKGSSKRAKAKRKSCVKKNAADKKAWKKKHHLK